MMKKWIEMFHCHLPLGSQEQICDVFWVLAWLPKKKLNFFFPKQRKGQIFMHNYNTYIHIGVCVRVHMYLYALQCCIHTCNTPQNKYYISIKEKYMLELYLVLGAVTVGIITRLNRRQIHHQLFDTAVSELHSQMHRFLHFPKWFD